MEMRILEFPAGLTIADPKIFDGIITVDFGTEDKASHIISLTGPGDEQRPQADKGEKSRCDNGAVE